ncbi:MAG: hypothetical protein M2R45_03121 [Verrucomicrobia subdivision 3 bacterium]|nr:hypothetical protein [Limisphaerales bacterium]MCS1413189.1 hypothetical protein [Limisphaerales bacterium]
MTVWLAIGNIDVGNSCMRFVAGSLLRGHLTYRPISPEEYNDSITRWIMQSSMAR